MRKIPAGLMAIALAACSTVQSPQSFYRAPGDAAQLAIGGTVTQRVFALTANGYSHQVEITINGETVIIGDMGGANSADYSTQWQGRHITASCMTLASDRFLSRAPTARCLIFVNGERAGTVSM